MPATILACSGAVSNEDYVAALLDVCDRLEREVPDFVEPRGASEVVTSTAQVEDAAETALGDLRDVAPPEEWRDEHDEMVAALAEVEASAGELRVLYEEIEGGATFSEDLNARENVLAERIDEAFSRLTSASAGDVLGESYGGDDYACAVGYHVS